MPRPSPGCVNLLLKVKASNIPIAGTAINAVSNTNTLGDILGGAFNTGYDMLAFIPRFASASAGKVSEFIIPSIRP